MSHIDRTPRILILGEIYTVWIWGRMVPSCQFIKVTEKGYNFLNLDTSKCILYPHLYPWKKAVNNTTFYVHKRIQILKQPRAKVV